MFQKSTRHLGKIGFIVIAIGMILLFYDAYRINQLYPMNYVFYQHPEMYVPIMGMSIAFIGTFLFIFNFVKGRTVI
ncbi:MAG: hypothetical protein ACR2LL_00855 [Nitrosopumilus sp.]